MFSFKSSVAHTACTVFEDNQGVIALAKVPANTPRSKHIAILYHFFREHVRRKKIDVVYVATNDQYWQTCLQRAWYKSSLKNCGKCSWDGNSNGVCDFYLFCG